MNDTWGYDETDDQETANNIVAETPAELRAAYKALKKQNEELINSLNADRAERAKEKVKSVFSELGVPGAAELYQGEPDPEKARAWAESMRAAFGSGAQGTDPATSSTPPAPTLDASAAAQLQQFNEAGQTGTPLGNFEAANAAVGQANDLNSLIAAMAQANHLNPGQ
jgi:hypothetical protein